jgi:hypothetical protein
MQLTADSQHEVRVNSKPLLHTLLAAITKRYCFETNCYYVVQYDSYFERATTANY